MKVLICILLYQIFLLMMQNTKQISKKMVDQLADNIEKQIENSTMPFGQNKGNLQKIINSYHQSRIANSKNNHSNIQQVQPKLQALTQLKQSKLVQLRELQRKEDILKRSRTNEKSLLTVNSSKLQRSRLTVEQIDQIKMVLAKQKKFEQKLQEKERKYFQYLQQKKKQEEELKQIQMSQKCQKRRQQVQNKLRQIQKKKQERKLKFQQDKARLQQIKQKKFLYEQLNLKSKLVEAQTYEEKRKYLQKHKQSQKINYEQLQQHQMKYLQQKHNKSQKRQQDCLQKSRSMAKMNVVYAKSKALKSVQKHQQQQNQREQMKKNEKESNIAKQKIYAKQVNELFLPKIVTRRSTETVEKQQPIKQILNNAQSYKLGTDYMRSAHKKITLQQLQKYAKTLQPVAQTGGYSAYYSNYLKQLHQKSKQNSVNYTVKDVQSISRDNSLGQQQKLKKMKRIITHQDKAHKMKDSELIDSIQSKMVLLRQMIVR